MNCVRILGTVLSDPDGVYDPGNYNDRLLLGLKGTMSEAELHIMNGRLAAGRMNKARRGELFNHAPMGYVPTASGEMVLDPDEQVQSVVRLIFDKFQELASLNSLLQYLVQQRILLGFRPHYGAHRGQLEWRRPNRPTCKTCYTIPCTPALTVTVVGSGPASQDSWTSHDRANGGGRNSLCGLLKDRLPAYITWERYEANLAKLAENQARGRV